MASEVARSAGRRAGVASPEPLDDHQGAAKSPTKPRPKGPPPLSKAERQLAEMFRLRPTVIEGKAARPHPPLQDRGTEETIRAALEQQSKMPIRTKPPAGGIEIVKSLPPGAKPVIKAIPNAPQAPIPVRLEAEKQIRELEGKHAKLKSQLERAIDRHAKEAARLRSLSHADAKRGIFREGLDGAAWHFEHQAVIAKGLLRELEIEHQAARYAYDALVGRVNGPGMRQGDGRKVAPNGAGSAAERFAERVARYNRSVETLKSSGPIAAVVATTVPLAAALNGNDSLDDEHYRVMDAIHQAGTIGNIPLQAKEQSDARAKGAAPVAPGVDHRREVLREARDGTVRSNQPALRGDR